MTAQPLRHPIGFSPAEISALVNDEVVSRHAEEAAFLWALRNRAVAEPHYSLDDLASLDERVEAHLDGLRISGDAGWERCKANLEIPGAGEAFVLSAIAFAGGDRERMREALLAGCSSPQVTAGFVSALGWLDFGEVSPWITRLLQATSPAHRALGLRAAAIHRQDPGAALASAVIDSNPVLRAAALRAVGELKRLDLRGDARVQLRSNDDACRFWAAWALVITGEREGLTELTGWFEGPEPFAMRALQLGLRTMSIDESREHISGLVKNPELERRAVIGAGIVADPTAIPWLIRKMESPDLARLAGEAFTMITGVDLAYDDLDRDAPASTALDGASIEEVLDLTYESSLPWPSFERVAQWWERNRPAFTPATRYLAGKPITQEWAREVLVRGKQRQRAAAALELAVLQRDRMLFEVRGRGNRQQRDLAV